MTSDRRLDGAVHEIILDPRTITEGIRDRNGVTSCGITFE